MIHTTQEWNIVDALKGMGDVDDNFVDLITTDPPYGYSFMGKDWDKAVPTVDLWREALRILKPGAFAFIMSAPRQDVLAHNLVNLSDAGFETGFTSIYHVYASGFPKATNVGKYIDKRACKEQLIEELGRNPTKEEFHDAWEVFREVIGLRSKRYLSPSHGMGHGIYANSKREGSNCTKDEVDGFKYATIPSTPHAKALDGSYAGFQPKPAVEVIMVVMKPPSEKTYVDQALANGKGITWLDDGRIPIAADDRHEYGVDGDEGDPCANTYGERDRVAYQQNAQGRFPANLLVSDDVLNDGKERISKYGKSTEPLKDSMFLGANYGEDRRDACNEFVGDSGSFSRYFDLDAWWDARIKHLSKEAQKTFPFMIVPKASKSEKGDNNKHPTVKSVKLFSWLITIGSREGDLVLDPFLGSGTTLEAGRMTNRNVLGFEIDPQWEHLYANRCMSHTPPLTSYSNE